MTPERKFRYWMPTMMALIMSFVMSGVVTALNLGFSGAFMGQWLHAWAIAFPVAALTAITAFPVARKLSVRGYRLSPQVRW
jgi:hypothetical protein